MAKKISHLVGDETDLMDRFVALRPKAANSQGKGHGYLWRHFDLEANKDTLQRDFKTFASEQTVWRAIKKFVEAKDKEAIEFANTRPTACVFATIRSYLDKHEPKNEKAESGNTKSKFSDGDAIEAVRQIMGRKASLTHEKLYGFAGTYALYRPWHIKPREQIICERLIVESSKGGFRCTLSSRHPTNPNDGFEAVGRAIPLAKKMLILLHGKGDRDDQLILHIDRYHKLSTGEVPNQIEWASGIVIGSVEAQNERNSAWPFYAERIQEGEEPFRNVEGVEIKKLFARIGRLHTEALDRGSVFWSPDDFPRDFGSMKSEPKVAGSER